MVPDVIHVVKICWMLCLREVLCFCAGGEFPASSITCSVMLLTTASDGRKLKYYQRTRKHGLWLFSVSCIVDDIKFCYEKHINVNTIISRLNK